MAVKLVLVAKSNRSSDTFWVHQVSLGLHRAGCFWNLWVGIVAYGTLKDANCPEQVIGGVLLRTYIMGGPLHQLGHHLNHPFIVGTT